jgi:hypothetical protein
LVFSSDRDTPRFIKTFWSGRYCIYDTETFRSILGDTNEQVWDNFDQYLMDIKYDGVYEVLGDDKVPIVGFRRKV